MHHALHLSRRIHRARHVEFVISPQHRSPYVSLLGYPCYIEQHPSRTPGRAEREGGGSFEKRLISIRRWSCLLSSFLPFFLSR